MSCLHFGFSEVLKSKKSNGNQFLILERASSKVKIVCQSLKGHFCTSDRFISQISLVSFSTACSISHFRSVKHDKFSIFSDIYIKL